MTQADQRNAVRRRCALIRLASVLITALAILPCCLPLLAASGDPMLLDLRVVEGDGSSYRIGSRATRGVTVQVSDESGRPVNGAIVSFTLPASGPSGVFASGGRNEIVITKADGLATVWGMQWNREPGPLAIRITAAKGQARAGILCSAFLTGGAPAATDIAVARAAQTKSDPSQTLGEPAVHEALSTPGKHSGLLGSKWLWITVAVAGGAVLGVAAVGKNTAGAPSATPASTSNVQIGVPTISLGHP